MLLFQEAKKRDEEQGQQDADDAEEGDIEQPDEVELKVEENERKKEIFEKNGKEGAKHDGKEERELETQPVSDDVEEERKVIESSQPKRSRGRPRKMQASQSQTNTVSQSKSPSQLGTSQQRAMVHSLLLNFY